jgi:hypothetical protein
MDKAAGTITFRAKKGRLVDLDKLHESIWATRLGDRTGMELKRLQVTAVGEVVLQDREVQLKVAGSDQYFVLAGGENASLLELRRAVERGDKVVSVTGLLEGWGGNFTQFLKTVPGKPRRILVSGFETAR